MTVIDFYCQAEKGVMIVFILCILGIVQFREDIIRKNNRRWLFKENIFSSFTQSVENKSKIC